MSESASRRSLALALVVLLGLGPLLRRAPTMPALVAAVMLTGISGALLHSREEPGRPRGGVWDSARVAIILMCAASPLLVPGSREGMILTFSLCAIAIGASFTQQRTQRALVLATGVAGAVAGAVAVLLVSWAASGQRGAHWFDWSVGVQLWLSAVCAVLFGGIGAAIGAWRGRATVFAGTDERCGACSEAGTAEHLRP